MACPLCGEVCRCSYVPDSGAERTGSVLVDPEDYDPSEEQFAASVLEEIREPEPALRRDDPDIRVPHPSPYLARVGNAELPSGDPSPRLTHPGPSLAIVGNAELPSGDPSGAPSAARAS